MRVTTKLTTWGELATVTPSTSDAKESTSSPVAEGEAVLEGWQRHWEEPAFTNTCSIPPANNKWLKDSEEEGLFSVAKPYRSSSGEVVLRTTLKNQMEFHPPPLPCVIGAGLPSMLSFFTTPVFFWRPVGVMKANIKCPNNNCPAPPGTYLIRCGYGTSARQVCGIRNYYTLLTERLKCSYCKKLRHSGPEEQDHNSDDDIDETSEQQQQQQYLWMSWSPAILMALAPAIRNMFPAILCGRRAVDKNVVTQLGDRINAVSMSKVHRMVQQGHDEWYAERRDLYQTLLYEAHASSSSSSQWGILSFLKPPGSYTPPLKPIPIPCARLFRRAHMLLEMERLPPIGNPS